VSVPARVAILGAGNIGSGWAALFAAHGASVTIFDPDPAALTRARHALAIARTLPVHPPAPREGELVAAAALGEAVRGAEWVQESIPDVLALKRNLLETLADVLPPKALVASSTSTLTPSALADGLPFEKRLLVAHPLHPVYAVPIVELCGGPSMPARTLERAASVMRSVGREPMVVRGEPPGLVAHRLTMALLDEAARLVRAGAVTEAELDRIVARGIATGWIVAGAIGTEAIGAGTGSLPEDAWARAIARVLAAAPPE